METKMFYRTLKLSIFCYFSIACVTGALLDCSLVYEYPYSSSLYSLPQFFGQLALHPARELPTKEACVITDFSISRRSIASGSVTFPDYFTIQLRFPSIADFGSELFEKFSDNTQNLELYKGSVKEIYYYSSTLVNVKIIHTGLSAFDVVAERNEILKSLVINSRQLRAIPLTVKYLQALELLDFSECALQFVSIDHLSELTNLKNLILADNQITTISVSSSATLPSLSILSVQVNQLESIYRFPEVFPNLKFAKLIANRWSCDWVDAARADIWNNKIVVLGSESYCANMTSNGGLCCNGNLQTSISERIAIAEELFAAIAAIKGLDSDDSQPNITFNVQENGSSAAVVGANMESVGVYLQDPLTPA